MQEAKPIATAMETYPQLLWLKHIVEIGAILSPLWPSAANVPRWQRPLVDALGPPRLSDAETPGLAAP